MNESASKADNSTRSTFATFYDPENKLFVVDFTGPFPFAETSRRFSLGGMFIHGVCTDGAAHADGRDYMAFNKVALTEHGKTLNFRFAA